jgi:hypothetical protein
MAHDGSNGAVSVRRGLRAAISGAVTSPLIGPVPCRRVAADQPDPLRMKGATDIFGRIATNNQSTDTIVQRIIQGWCWNFMRDSTTTAEDENLNCIGADYALDHSLPSKEAHQFHPDGSEDSELLFVD